MTKKVKLALIGLVLVAGLASPALAQSFDDDRTGNVVSFSSQSGSFENASRHVTVYAARRHGMNSFAMEPRAPIGFQFQSVQYFARAGVRSQGTSAYPFGPGINFPYPDRPYGDPDHW